MLPSTSTAVEEMQELTSHEELDKCRKASKDKGLVVLCSVSWYEPCKEIHMIMSEMARNFKHLMFAWVDCDKFEGFDKYEVDTAPTILIFHPHKSEIDRLINPSPDKLNSEIETQNENYKNFIEIDEKERVFQEIKVITTSAPIVAFIKGTPTEPKWKFTRRLLGHFNKDEIKYKSFNILEDERIRQWLKIYSNWPTFPQVFINGEFVGGIDVVSELVEDGEFLEMVPKEWKRLKPVERFEQVLDISEVVVLVRGGVENPSDEESKSLLTTLTQNSIKYVAVDYSQLSEDVKSHISTNYSVKDCPYIFISKQPFGNEETLLKSINENQLETVIPAGSRKLSLNDRLKQLINSSGIMIFIKGNPTEPQWGFSRTLVEILNQYDYQYGYFDILTDEVVRQGLKDYSKWQTYPQLYVKGKFIGGVDVVKELHEEHELEDELKEVLA